MPHFTHTSLIILISYATIIFSTYGLPQPETDTQSTLDSLHVDTINDQLHEDRTSLKFIDYNELLERGYIPYRGD